MSLRIEPVDTSEPASFAPFYEVYAAALRHGPQGEYATVWQPEEIRVAMADPDERRFRLGWTGWDGDRVVATGWMQGSNVDNTELADVLVCCPPDARGHGYAAAMLAHVEDQARSLGRSRLVGEVVWPYADGVGRRGLDRPGLGAAQRLRARAARRAAAAGAAGRRGGARRAGRRGGRAPRGVHAADVQPDRSPTTSSRAGPR